MSPPSGATVTEVDVADASLALVARHGEEVGFEAAAFALERGYDGGQIVDAAAEGRLEADGTIVDVEPILQPADVIELAASLSQWLRPEGGHVEEIELTMQGCGNVGDGPVEVDWLRCRITDSAPASDLIGDDARGVWALVWLATTGYDTGQIVEAMISGGTIERAWFENDVDGIDYSCIHLRVGNEILVPTGSGPDSCATDIARIARTDSEQVAEDDTAVEDESGGGIADRAPTDPSLTLDNLEVAFTGCPDANFPDRCMYDLTITMSYETPSLPSRLSCASGFGTAVDVELNDPVGTETVTVVYSVLRNNPALNPDVLDASCWMNPTGGEPFDTITLEFSADRPDG